jgi:hypothetical protein
MKNALILTIGILALVLLTCLIVLPITEAHAAEADKWPSRSLCLENWVNQARITNPYLVIIIAEGTYAGKVVKSDGTIAANTAYADADIAGSDDAISDEPVYSIPALPMRDSSGNRYRYRILLRGRAGVTPANTDTCYDAGNYDPEMGRFYSNTVPVVGDMVRVIQQP